jgi:hypothetical protein
MRRSAGYWRQYAATAYSRSAPRAIIIGGSMSGLFSAAFLREPGLVICIP